MNCALVCLEKEEAPTTVTTRAVEHLRALISDLDDATLLAAIRNLGGHDIPTLLEAFAQIDDSRPTAVIAYTIKGFGLPSSGHPQNHSALIRRGRVFGTGRTQRSRIRRRRGRVSTPTPPPVESWPRPRSDWRVANSRRPHRSSCPVIWNGRTRGPRPRRRRSVGSSWTSVGNRRRRPAES